MSHPEKHTSRDFLILHGANLRQSVLSTKQNDRDFILRTKRWCGFRTNCDESIFIVFCSCQEP